MYFLLSFSLKAIEIQSDVLKKEAKWEYLIDRNRSRREEGKEIEIVEKRGHKSELT